MRSKIAMRKVWPIRMRRETRGPRSTTPQRGRHAAHRQPATPYPYDVRRPRLAFLLTTLLGLPLLGWLVERLIEHVPALERLSTATQRQQYDPFHDLLSREQRARATVSAPQGLSEGVLARIAALPQAAQASEVSSAPPAQPLALPAAPIAFAAVPGMAEMGWPAAWPPAWSASWPAAWTALRPSTSDGGLVRPAGVVLGVLWFWALVSLWTSCLVGLTDPTLASRVLDALISAIAHAVALLQGIGHLLAVAGANVPMTAGLSLLALVLSLVAWMVIARQFNRLVLGA